MTRSMDAKASIGGCIAAIQVLAIIATPLLVAQPVAVADNQYVTITDTQLTVAFPGVLANDVAQRPVDSDGDGFLDSEELTHGSNPGSSNSIPSVGTIVSTNTALASAVSAASAGDIIVMAEGTYTNLVLTISRSGTSGNPITIRSRTVGGAVITGTSSIILGGSHLVLDGVIFTNGRPGNSQGAIRVNGSHNRVTNCSVVGFNDSDPLIDTDWIGLNGQYNRVDHCLFSGKIGPGPLFVVWRSINKPDYHQIDHNVFKDYAAGASNGYETMRVGTSGESQTSSYTVVESNYFENCDGEVEIISNKSCNNTYRGNTFVSCYGALTLRHGNSCLVEGNVFLANGQNSAGGIRIIDKDHVVRNNYIEGSRNRGGLILSTGIVNSPLNAYWEVRNVLLANNSIINSSNSFYYGEGDNALPPVDITFTNNIARNNINGDGQFNIIYQRHPITNPTYSGEVYFGSSLGITPTPPGVETNVNPDLVQNAQGLWIDSGGKGAQNITRLYESDCGPLSRVPLTATLASGVGANGTLNLNANGGFTFVPAAGFTGPVTFTYYANDGGEASATPATVTITVTSPDQSTPTPNPMTFASPPAATGQTSITMTATTATDPSGVEYRFNNVTLASSSPWQDSPVYTATGLTPATSYSFTVQARDESLAQNTTTASASASATTVAPEISSAVMYTDSNGLNPSNTPYSDGYVVHTFYSGSNIFTPPAAVTSVDVLVVGGGGGGGGIGTNDWGAGGGAGGLVYSNAFPVTPSSNYTVTVGGGGTAGGAQGGSGSNSVFGTLTALGGGGGSDDVTSRAGVAGGSGGGSYGGTVGSGQQAGSGSGGFGNSGGLGGGGGGGGGGGAGAPGAAAGTTYAGAGGIGRQYSISGVATYYAGGGSGAGNSTGGLGGGGRGGVSGQINGVANTGGGGAGAVKPSAAGSGGSGIVIVRYQLDTTAPTLSTTNPANGASEVLANTNLVVTFSEPIAIGTGNITLKNLTDGTQADIAVTDATQVSVSGAVLTLDPTADLLSGKNYAVRIADTAIDDTTGNSFVGITDDTTWNFATASAYETWTAANAPGSAADDDSDNDGVPNGIEFVLGGDKDSNDLGKLPTVATPGADMTFAFVRDQASIDPGVSVEIVVGPDLTTWPDVFIVGADTASSTEGVTVTDNGDGTDTITLSIPREPGTKKFARLVVVITP